MSKKYVQIDPRDNIIVAITDLEEGTVIDINGENIILRENIRAKHKFALQNFSLGDEIYMYGVLIGKAIMPIHSGCAITIDNVKHASSAYNNTKENFKWNAPDVSNFKERTFMGYH
ncbi:MAG: UxaA family hydrolase, partial [Eudoraea sp.]